MVLATGTGPGNDSPDSGANRTSQAYHDLRALILSGHYEPDSRLTESELTTQLQVSRGTIRSVLARLAQEGYVTAEANRSARTRSFSVDEAVEILETRAVMEAALAAKAAERATDTDIAAMTETCKRMWDWQVPGGREEYANLNRKFHEQVKRAARQATLTRFVDSLLYPLVMQQYRDADREQPRTDSVREHEAILAAIVTHNPEAAAAAMRHHLSSARRALQLKFPPPAD
ncbi:MULTISPECIES: GntR family transcriptional regulator [Rhodococcus]|jgi:DNA-binding GntR family transcriptional regulator|uniref:GntR family transcriptional regulator n=1 Tax=Rhodococcus TaxID=1827 RepID=UPI000567B745|nr:MULTISPECIES: GntR family transcriptional regulator [Rhodococcus]KXF54606.1 GntR family transcriptional regulator [Rhodococcus sp. SC4]RZK70529.1 MAG: GntR family transcriptional regulator [Rhodococcus sp. (in: high G+C Gram-positive bacteria)]KXX62262.1 GntR family transcriptional regulator [Rhodococcus sp. LB1]PBC55391.1 GntR family transcriptional regulator [Rhodococcus sp. ACPA1]UDG97454.1 GntR family transcriptional regulator [Rhodococcus opacus PD630]